MKKKLSLADIKSGVLIDAPEKISVEIMVKGEVREFETCIKIMDYSTAIAQMEANQKNKEALASILANCIVDENGEPEFTEEEVRKRFNKPLIDAIWSEILKKNFLGKATATTNSEEKSSGQNSSLTGSGEKQSLKQKEISVTESTSSGGNIEKSEAD